MSSRLFGFLAACVTLATLSSWAQAAPVVFDDNEYFLTSTAQGWFGAEAEAEADGGHLASVHSAAENQFIVNTFLSGATITQVLWVGLHDPTQNDGTGAQHAADFIWSDGTPVDYTNWNTGTGEPNNYNNMEYWTATNWHYAASGAGAPGTWNDLAELGSASYSVAVNGPYFGIIEIPVTEPASLAVFGISLAGFGLIRRKRA